MFPIIPHLLSFTPMPPTQLRDLEREVFGGSDSEFSDDDDDNDGPPLLSPLVSCSLFSDLQLLSAPQQPSPGSPHKQPPESSGPDSDDDYVHEKRPGKSNKLSQGSTKRASDDRPLQRKRKRKTPLNIDPNDLPPEQGALSLHVNVSPFFSDQILSFKIAPGHATRGHPQTQKSQPPAQEKEYRRGSR